MKKLNRRGRRTLLQRAVRVWPPLGTGADGMAPARAARSRLPSVAAGRMAARPLGTAPAPAPLAAGSWVYVTDDPRTADLTVVVTTQPRVAAVPVSITPDRGAAAMWVYVTADPRYAGVRVYVLNPDVWDDWS